MKLSRLFPLLLPAALAPVSRAEVQYVIAISIDAGRGDFIQTLCVKPVT